MQLRSHCFTPDSKNAKVVDYEVRRYPVLCSVLSKAVPEVEPPLETFCRNDVCAGDWVRMGDENMVPKACARTEPMCVVGSRGKKLPDSGANIG